MILNFFIQKCHSNGWEYQIVSMCLYFVVRKTHKLLTHKNKVLGVATSIIWMLISQNCCGKWKVKTSGNFCNVKWLLRPQRK